MINKLLLLILPVFSSGITFIVFLKLVKTRDTFLDLPLDSGIKFNGRRLLGDNKTIKGPIMMGLFTMFYGFVVYQFTKGSLNLMLSNFEITRDFLLIGLSYSFGELPNSFLKRQLSIPPGQLPAKKFQRIFFKFTDTFDSLIPIGLVAFLFFKFSPRVIMTALLIGGLIHLITDHLMRLIKLKQ